jgi:hypothetical protein
MAMRSFSLLLLCLAPALTMATEPEPKKTVDFERQIQGMLGKLGCNTGSCHGSFQGKGGLYLSLFGYSAEKDYVSLTRDAYGRRINLNDPDQSLMLLKATGQITHGGGQRLAKDSPEYQLLRDWIVQGAKWDKGTGEVNRLAVEPARHKFEKATPNKQIKVIAHFTNGDSVDVTSLCDFRSNDDFVAEVSARGDVKAMNPGDTAVVISYRGNVETMRAMVPYQANEFAYPALSPKSPIDEAVFAKLRELNIVPSVRSSDAEFLRRVTIDTIGCLPTPDEVRTFLADPDPDKRAKKIDELLAHPMHAALWATKLSDVTGNNVDLLLDPNNQAVRARRAKMWHDWLRKRIADNVPYDQIVKGILTATSREGKEPGDWIKEIDKLDKDAELGFDSKYADRETLDLFWRKRNFTLELMGEQTATAFLGVRIECAQCHKHPFDRWTQADYRGYANIFAQVVAGLSPETRAEATKINQERREKVDERRRNQVVQINEVFVLQQPKEEAGRPARKPMNRRANLAKPPLRHPDSNEVLPPKTLGGPALDYDGDAREALYQWLVSADNAWFARSFANRVWAHYFGIGIVDPVDNFSVANPPSNPQLLDLLGQQFIKSKFDIRALERAILNSAVYQQSSEPNETNVQDKNNFARSYVRRTMAEVVVDMLNSAMDTKESFGIEAPPGSRAIEIATNRATGNLGYIFRVFGRSPRTSTCDCERSTDPALPQTLFLMTDQTVLSKITSGRLKKLLQAKIPDDEMCEELYLATLSRYPTESEQDKVLGYVKAKKDRNAAWSDVVWALINTREFILNH